MGPVLARAKPSDVRDARSQNRAQVEVLVLWLPDAPETPHGTKPGQPYGEEARNYLDHLIAGKTVRVDADGAGRYHRVLAVIWDGSVNVNRLMVAMGYAEVYRGASCQAYYRESEEAQAKARQDRVGMWAQGPKTA